jgi:hypothetical protein
MNGRNLKKIILRVVHRTPELLLCIKRTCDIFQAFLINKHIHLVRSVRCTRFEISCTWQCVCLSLPLHEAAGHVLGLIRASSLIVISGVSSWHLWQKPMSKQWPHYLPPIIHSVHFCFLLSVCHMNVSGPVSAMNFNGNCWKEFFLQVAISFALLNHVACFLLLYEGAYIHLRNRGPIPGRGNTFFSITSRLGLAPTQSLSQWIPAVISPEVKRHRSEADYSSPSSGEVKNGGAVPSLCRTSVQCVVLN